MKLLTILFAIALALAACDGKSGENVVRDGGHGIGIDTETVNQIQLAENSANLHSL